MINILSLLIGMLLPTIIGWTVLRVIEGHTPVLGKVERIAWSIVLGSTLMMLLIFVLHVLGLVQLTLLGFLLPGVIVTAGLWIYGWKKGILFTHDIAPIQERPMKKWLFVILMLLLVWTGIKLLAGTYDVLNVPTYWDDSFNNWNMRGKVFFVEEKISLEYDIGNEQQQSTTGVSSYPPTVPMVKTWLSTVRGTWKEPIVNGVHVIWFVALLLALSSRITLLQGRTRGLLAVYVLASLPLVMIHGTNPYADVFVSAHVLIALLSVYHIGIASENEKKVWILLSALSIGALIFTKNEALLLYTPPLTVLLLWQLLRRNGTPQTMQGWMKLVLPLLLILILAAPWIAFKWSHGLTFGNAKTVSGQSFMLNVQAADSVWFSLSHEANVLLLPLLLIVSLTLQRVRALSFPLLPVTLFAVLVVLVQFSLFIFIPSLATEAIMQTGLARGLVQMSPVWVLLLFLLWPPQEEA